jgi:hypothetical protein
MSDGKQIILCCTAILFLCTLAPAFAAPPTIPSSAMPGRERERFTTSPVERFMQPGAQSLPEVVRPNQKCRRPSTRHRKGARNDCPR